MPPVQRMPPVLAIAVVASVACASGTDDGSPPLEPPHITDTNQYHDGTVTKGTAYVYRVMAMPKAGGHGTDTKFSNEASFTAP